jgi:hypothetical protein
MVNFIYCRQKVLFMVVIRYKAAILSTTCFCVAVFNVSFYYPRYEYDPADYFCR